jgi:NAD-dependent deacetylase
MDNEQKTRYAGSLIAQAKHAVALTGAGISTPSGIPDFRTPGAGLWELTDPMSVGSIWGFVERPEAFYEWVRPLARLMLSALPNPAHLALAELQALGRLQAVITQNIDDLHQRAGSKRVLEVHGHLRQATCVRCYNLVPAQQLIAKFVADGIVPTCQVCGGVMKPNVVLFGEVLPVSVMYAAEQESKACDVMVVAGSSLEVAPAGDLPFAAKEHGAKIIVVNRMPTIADAHAAVVLREDVATALPRIVEAVKSAGW